MISVIIPVYNAENFVRKAVLSAVNNVKVGEIILIEDCSPDNALLVCRNLEKEFEKVILIVNDSGVNYGASKARNIGISKSKFDYISFLDADDYYLPNRFDADVELFSRLSDVDGVYGSSKGIFESDALRQKYLLRHNADDAFTERLDAENLLPALLFGGKGYFNTNTITLRKSVFSKVGYFDTSLKLSQDTELWIRLAAVCKLVPGNIESPIAIRTVHENNRVLDTDEVVSKYRKLVYMKLFTWAVKRLDLSFTIMNHFFMAYHMHVNQTQNNAFIVLMQLAVKNPLLATKIFFYRKIYQISFYKFLR